MVGADPSLGEIRERPFRQLASKVVKAGWEIAMYKTSRETNEVLTRVGPGTPMGDLLRRYWWPVGVSTQLKEKPTFVRLLGEDLVLFCDRQDRTGVLGALCSHRRANLCLGKCGQRRAAVPVSRVAL